MLAQNPAAGGADRPGRQNILVLFDGQDLAADKAGHADPVQQAEDKEERDHVGAELLQRRDRIDDRLQSLVQHNRQQDDEQRIRQRVDDIDNAHHDNINGTAAPGRNRTVEQADDQHHDRRDKADGQRNAGAVNHADKVVTAKAVRAHNVGEQLFPGFGHIFKLTLRILERGQVGNVSVTAAADPDDFVIPVGDEHRQHQNGQHQQHQYNDAADSQFVFHQPAHAVFEEGYAFAHNLLLGLFFRRGGGEIRLRKFGKVNLRRKGVLFGHAVFCVCHRLGTSFSYSRSMRGSITL